MDADTLDIGSLRRVAEPTGLAHDSVMGGLSLARTKRLYHEGVLLEALKSVDDLVIALDNLGVPGPLTVHAAASTCLGEGGQFIVHEGDLLDPSTDCEVGIPVDAVAIKTPKFEILADGRLDVSSSRSRRQVNDFYLEVASLRRPELHRSRKVVELLGWAVGQTIHQAPSLVFELALGNMASIFGWCDITWRVKQQLCLDVGNGLDAIHRVGIVHSDLKPENVLVFDGPSRDVPFMAKLADFGASCSEEGAAEDVLLEVKGLSQDWSAPEVTLGAMLPFSNLVKADTFSYGLLLLGFNCQNASPLRPKDLNTAMDVARRTTVMPQSYQDLLVNALPRLLQEIPEDRPREVGSFFENDSEACESWKWEETNGISRDRFDQPGPYDHPWKLPSLGAYLFLGLEASFRRVGNSITGAQLFGMFLMRSYHDAASADKSLQLEMLRASANKGYIPAQATIGRVHESYGVPFNNSQMYLFNGAASGSSYAMDDLNTLDSDLAIEARAKFMDGAGYNQFFSPLISSSLDSHGTTDADDNTILHQLAANGPVTALRSALLKIKNRALIDIRNRHGETPLYKACLTGSYVSVIILCQHGADASIPSYLNGLSCLHWAFNFPPAHIGEVISALLGAGAYINSTAHTRPSSVLANHHFPFDWPLGTPLHFAIQTRNHVAIRAFMAHGADVEIRSICDPYLADENVRQLHVHGTAETGETSRPKKPPLGLTPMDLAAALHDYESLESLASRPNGQPPGLAHTPDEEGYTPFHRLSYLRVGRTSTGLRYWFPAFRGSPQRARTQLVRTIRTLQRYGGDINQLTNTPQRPGLQGVSGVSPLMIAVTKGDCETVSALLEAGADVNLLNRDRRSALMLLPSINDTIIRPAAVLEITRMLLDAGARVNDKSSDDASPLSAAMSSSSVPCVQMLLQAQADISVSVKHMSIIAGVFYNSSYMNLLAAPASLTRSQAEEQEHDLVAILEQVFFQEHGWAHQADLDNGSLLHWAARSGLTECVRVLLRAGFDREQVRKRHFTGGIPSYYYSFAVHIDEGTPFEMACQQEAHLLSSARYQLSQEDREYVIQKYRAVKAMLE